MIDNFGAANYIISRFKTSTISPLLHFYKGISYWIAGYTAFTGPHPIEAPYLAFTKVLKPVTLFYCKLLTGFGGFLIYIYEIWIPEGIVED